MDAHTVLIKHLELQITQLSTTENPHQPLTLPKNTIENHKNDGHCMEVTTRRGKKTTDPPMPSVVEDEIIKDKAVVETSNKLVGKAAKEAEVHRK